MPDLQVRPMRPDDVVAADAVAWSALQELFPPEFLPDEDERLVRGRARVAHLQRTDPAGAWVAEAPDGEIVGTALALVREGVWGLSLLGVRPDRQAGGVGGALLRAALATAEGTRGGIILSSTHPAAMRSYARAGFGLRPCVALSGVLDRRGVPSGLRARPGDPVADRETLEHAARHVRSASYEDDVVVLTSSGGCELLVIDGRGFAAHREGSPALLCATDEDAARDLLWSVFAAAAHGATVHVDFVMTDHDWAIDIGLRCGLSLSPEGPVFTRGDLGPLAPFLPSGAYL
jgi:GNAT superfamily N-acetyltransferase